MKQRFMMLAFFALLACLFSSAVFAQMGSVRGSCKDVNGKPIVGATVEYKATETGRIYNLKTDKAGEYFSLGIMAGTYNVRLLQDGKEIYHINGVHLGMDEQRVDINLQQEQEQTAKGQGLTPEQLKQMQEQQAKQQKEVTTVKALNEKLAAASQASAAGNYDLAISTLTEATQMDESRYLLWAKLAEAYLESAPKQTDSAEKTKRFAEAAVDYRKAIDLKEKENDQKPQSTQELAHYYNNLGNALGRSANTEDAVKAYERAAQLDPPGAGQYYFNAGAVLTNAGRVDDAIAAFDKSIAADPNKAESYYQKGVNLIGKATTDPKTGKITPAPGTQEALNKYLELSPNGPNAEAAKGMIQYIGGTIETSYGKPKRK